MQLWRLTLQLARRNWTILGLDTHRYVQIFPQRHWGTYCTTPLHSPGPPHSTSLQNIQCILPPKTYSTVLSPMPPEIQVPYCARRNIDTFVFSFCVYKMHNSISTNQHSCLHPVVIPIILLIIIIPSFLAFLTFV